MGAGTSRIWVRSRHQLDLQAVRPQSKGAARHFPKPDAALGHRHCGASDHPGGGGRHHCQDQGTPMMDTSAAYLKIKLSPISPAKKLITVQSFSFQVSPGREGELEYDKLIVPRFNKITGITFDTNSGSILCCFGAWVFFKYLILHFCRDLGLSVKNSQSIYFNYSVQRTSCNLNFRSASNRRTALWMRKSK